ncbi:MFS transporter [Kribbella sp. NBC_00889]|uniref:MFS transporter n=1 Tax=Kribbella sp. NBC_00889 TaxID=2975974 RepID=UPI00386830C7|nr:MFS transporter [Kribbella sp. NBC_00889]
MKIATKAPTGTTAALGVLFAGAFMMGTSDELVFGMLDLISVGLAVSVPAAGALVSANALGLMIGGPLLTLLTTRFDRRTVVLAATAAFVLLNLAPVLIDEYSLFLGSRVLVGAVQGLFIAAAITTATSMVPPERTGRAMAVVISGFATASALGLPLFTLLGQTLGWRTSFGAVVVTGLVVLLASTAVIPSVPTMRESRAVRHQLRHVLAPPVLAVLALCCLVFTAVQSAWTYLVPYLGEVTGVTGAAVTAFLLLYGVASMIGSAAGGRFADANAARTLVVGTIGMGASLMGMYLFGGSPVVMALTVLCVGLCMGMTPAMQHRVETLAGPGALLASSLPVSAVYAGIAGGSLTGGAAIDLAGLPAAVLTGAVIAMTAAGVAVVSRSLRPAAAPTSEQEAPEPLAVETIHQPKDTCHDDQPTSGRRPRHVRRSTHDPDRRPA